MHTEDRDKIAYLVVRDNVGPYLPGEHFQAENLHVDQAKAYIDAGTLVELEPGDVPSEVFEATKDKPRPKPKPPVDDAAVSVTFTAAEKPAKAAKAAKA